MGDRILSLIKALGENQASFARRLNTSSSRISNIVKGRNKPDSEMLAKIVIEYTNVNALWLLTERGEMLIDSDSEYQRKYQGEYQGNPEDQSADKVEDNQAIYSEKEDNTPDKNTTNGNMAGVDTVDIDEALSTVPTTDNIPAMTTEFELQQAEKIIALLQGQIQNLQGQAQNQQEQIQTYLELIQAYRMESMKPDVDDKPFQYRNIG